jgi:hypothetical protein
MVVMNRVFIIIGDAYERVRRATNVLVARLLPVKPAYFPDGFGNGGNDFVTGAGFGDDDDDDDDGGGVGGGPRHAETEGFLAEEGSQCEIPVEFRTQSELVEQLDAVLSDNGERVVYFARIVPKRRIFFTLVVSVLFTAFLFLLTLWIGSWIVFVPSIAFFWTVTGHTVWFIHKAKEWFIVTSQRIIIINLDTTVKFMYLHNFVAREIYPDGSGEIQFYDTVADYESKRNAVARLTHFASIQRLYTAVTSID